MLRNIFAWGPYRSLPLLNKINSEETYVSSRWTQNSPFTHQASGAKRYYCSLANKNRPFGSVEFDIGGKFKNFVNIVELSLSNDEINPGEFLVAAIEVAVRAAMDAGKDSVCLQEYTADKEQLKFLKSLGFVAINDLTSSERKESIPSEMQSEDNFVRVNLVLSRKKYDELVLVIKTYEKYQEQIESKKVFTECITKIDTGINAVRQHGNKVNKESPEKSRKLMALADAIEGKINELRDFDTVSQLNQTAYDAKCKAISTILDAAIKDKTLGMYRLNLLTIAKNIGIALTGIGLIALGIKVAVSYKQTGRLLAFFQEPKTTSEKLVWDIKDQFSKIKKPSP